MPKTYGAWTPLRLNPTLCFVCIAAISLLNKVASDLKRLVVVHQCVVLVVNHVSRWSREGTTEAQGATLPTPFLGRYWCSVPSLRLYIKHLSDNQFELTVVKNVYSAETGPKCSFSYFFGNGDTHQGKSNS